MTSALDRQSERRKDGAALAALLRERTTVLVPLWRNKNLVTAERPPAAALPTVADLPELADAADERVFLGTSAGVAYFAVDVSSTDSPLDTLGLRAHGELRELVGVGSVMAREEVRLLMYARAMGVWHRDAVRCPRCGGTTESGEGGHTRSCTACGRLQFPRTDPAVMIAVEREGRLLLARQPGFPPGMYSVLAGFVEPGESAEECVRREAREEVGLPLLTMRYVASEPWPFPRSLMLGFRCEAGEGEVLLDPSELEHYFWASPEELLAPEGFFTPPPLSLAHRLIRDFTGGRR